MEHIDNVKALLAAGCAGAAPLNLERGPAFAIVPDGYKVTSLESQSEQPARKRGNVITSDTDGFIYYLNKHGDSRRTLVYADIDAEASKFKLIAVIDDHGDHLDDAQWREHRCHFAPDQAVEWKRWIGSDKKVFSQADFATWLEDNLGDIASVPNMPTGADILKMALGFEANAEKRLRSKINLQNGGVQFEFVEDEDRDTRTKMEVFQRFTLGIPVFDGSTNAYPIEARLKYREKDGKVVFWYELIRPDRVFKTAVQDELTRIKDGTGFPVICGQP